MDSLRALSKGQERKAVEFLECSFQEIESAFKKRSEPSLSKLPTLRAYLDAMHHLLVFVLQIPPVDPSTSLRIAFLLRLTNDVMNAVPGYPPELGDLQTLLDFLGDLDEGWSTVLKSQLWDTSSKTGVDLPIDILSSVRSTPITLTERTRLHSLLITGTAGLEDWLDEGRDDRFALERFNALFEKTLAEMGGLSEPLIDPDVEMTETC